MNTQSNIIWLASYPKSGNTWGRIFLSNYLKNAETTVPFDQLIGKMASSRYLFDDYTLINSTNLTVDEIDTLRPRVFEAMNDEAESPIFLKVHEAYVNTPAQEPLFPAHVSRLALYFVRNPLDIVPSFAHHMNVDIDHVIQLMANPEAALANNPRYVTPQFRQPILMWHEHVHSWTSQTQVPIHVVRYEDMTLSPYDTFKTLVEKLEYPFEESRFESALGNSAFEKVRSQELVSGFGERHPHATSFFRSGKIGTWRNTLTDEQVATIVETHRDMMRKMGYLSADDAIIF